MVEHIAVLLEAAQQSGSVGCLTGQCSACEFAVKCLQVISAVLLVLMLGAG